MTNIQVINRIIVTICPLKIISSLSDNIVASFLAVKRTSRNFCPFFENIIKKYYFFFQEVIKIFLNFLSSRLLCLVLIQKLKILQ